MLVSGEMRFGISLSGLSRLVAFSCLAILSGCAANSLPPLEAMDRRVDLERFMGDWYVIGFIPVTIPFFSEEGAHNGMESYRLTDDGVIETTYTFRKGGFDGPEKRFTPKGWVYDQETNAEWRMQFLWPFKAAYLIVYLDDDYQNTIIGVPARKYVWIMSRDPDVSDAKYKELLDRVAAAGYDVERVQRVPQQWPSR
jgi:apolipoprotein D and lipocalin family protein